MQKIIKGCATVARPESHILKKPWYQRAAKQITSLLLCHPTESQLGDSVPDVVGTSKALDSMDDLEIKLGISVLRSVLEDPQSTFKGLQVSRIRDISVVNEFINEVCPVNSRCSPAYAKLQIVFG